MNTLIKQGDTFELIKQIPNQSVDLIWTSPPYFNIIDYGNETGTEFGRDDSSESYLHKTSDLAHSFYRVLKPTGVLVWNIMDLIVDGYPLLLESWSRRAFCAAGFQFHQRIVWFIPNKTPAGGDRRFANKFEWIIVLTKSKKFTFNKDAVRNKPTGAKKESLLGADPGNVWTIPAYKGGSAENLHPAAFPPELAIRVIRAYSNIGDTVLDPFVGCGTSAVCSALLNRRCVGFELNERHYNTAVARTENLNFESERLAKWL